MRRKRVSQFNPVVRRKGVTASEISRKTSVRIPVVRVTNSKGLAPTCLRDQSQSSSVNGTRALTKRTSLAKRVSFMLERGHPARSACAARSQIPKRTERFALSRSGQAGCPLSQSVVRAQIHPLVEMPNLLRIAIEQERWA